MEDKFQARLILEIIGRPAQNIVDALNGLADRMAKEKGVKMLERTVHPPIQVQDPKANDLYTTFAELLIECDSTSTFFGVVFSYMPANIEIIKPEQIGLSNSDLTGIANRIIQRLHNYDAIARRLIVDNQAMRKQLGLPLNMSSAPAANAEPVKQPEAKEEKKEEKKPKAKKAKSKKGKKK